MADAVGSAREETATQREQRLEGVRRRIETYETCAAAIASATSSLQELSANLDKMQVAAQQLNAFTSGWLACAVSAESAMVTPRKAERQPWNRSTRLIEVPRRPATRGDGEAEAVVAATTSHSAASGGLTSGERSCRGAQRASKKSGVRSTLSPGRAGRRAGNQDERERERTRAMIERAVSAAFGSASPDRSVDFELDDMECDGTGDGDALPLTQEAAALGAFVQPHGKENDQRQPSRLSAPPFVPFDAEKPSHAGLASAVERQKALRSANLRCRERHRQSNAQAQRAARSRRELHRRLSVAAVEFHARRHALQALYERVQREMRYLTAVAADLDKRQLLLEEAFASYEQALRAEYSQGEDT